MTARIWTRFHLWLAIGLIAGLALDGVALTAFADDDDGSCEIEDDDGNLETDGYCADQAIVRLAPGADVAAVNETFNTETIDPIAGQQLFLLELPQGSDEVAVAAQLQDEP